MGNFFAELLLVRTDWLETRTDASIGIVASMVG
jgi:hypothetical protein